MSDKTRVCVADDHAIVRDGLARLLGDTPDLDLVEQLATAEGIVERARRGRWDVLVLDSRMPGNEGVPTVRALCGLDGGPRVVVFTTFPEDSHALGFLHAGASAFLNKSRPLDELLTAIRLAAGGRRYITPSLADYLFELQLDPTRPPVELLTDRELEVVRLLAGGQRAKEAAAALRVSPSTVYTYVQRAKEKLGVRTTVEVVAFARDNGLL